MKCRKCRWQLPTSSAGGATAVCAHCGAENVLIWSSAGTGAPLIPPKRRFPVKLIIAVFISIGISGSGYAWYSSASLKHPVHTPVSLVSPAPTNSNPAPLHTVSSPVTATPSSNPVHASIKPASPVVPAPVGTPGTISAPQPCTKDTNYVPAHFLSVSASSAPGVHNVIEPTHYYTVYGNTGQQIRTELDQCSPVNTSTSEGDAETNWSVDYDYTLTNKAGNMCAVAKVAVGVHITFAYPQWTATSHAATGLAAQWQTYMANLKTHEDGHSNLAQQYGMSLYNNLSSYPDTSCTSIDDSLAAYGAKTISAMNQAEANYDAQTDHGATQGARFY